MEQQLVSFGNLLLKAVNATDDQGRERVVTDADLRNWEQETGERLYGPARTPFKQQYGDSVKCSILRDDATAKVIKVHCSARIQYDLEITYFDATHERNIKTRVYNVDSALVYGIEDENK